MTMPAQLITFHEGEVAMHCDLKVPRSLNPTWIGFHTKFSMRIIESPLVAIGTLDEQGRPWTTIWGGERGFARPVAENVLGFNSAVDKRYDPVFRAFWDGAAGEEEGGVVRPGGEKGKMMAALTIDLETRDRVKLAGRMIAGADVPGSKQEVQMAMYVTESMGNCPKYLNKKDLVRCVPRPEHVSEGGKLPEEAVRLIDRADMLFLSSYYGEHMDTNHRGGPPGFVRIVRNDAKGVELVYPEYSGNRLYQTLGNLRMNPLVGIIIPDYETSDAIYLTGSASILIGKEASALIARSQVAVKITVTGSRFVKETLPFRGTPNEFSPYNPAVRHLVSERQQPVSDTSSTRPDVNANLIRREVITPTISLFTFKLESRDPIPKWQAGQHITLDFEMEVGGGYAHMRDEDPQSLNDDYVRTFTVSSPPGSGKEDELQITARLHGPVTGFLWRHSPQVPLVLPVLGFGGEAAFRIPTTTCSSVEPVFVAGGVGITPILAQARGVLDGSVPLTLLWTLRGEDIPLAVHVFDKIPGLAPVTSLFVTGTKDAAQQASKLLEEVREGGATVEERRIGAGDVEGFKGKGKKFYVCTGQGLLKSLEGWLEGEDVVWEDFGY